MSKLRRMRVGQSRRGEVARRAPEARRCQCWMRRTFGVRGSVSGTRAAGAGARRGARGGGGCGGGGWGLGLAWEACAGLGGGVGGLGTTARRQDARGEGAVEADERMAGRRDEGRQAGEELDRGHDAELGAAVAEFLDAIS